MPEPRSVPLSSSEAVLRSLLLAWFDRHQRDLPWRRTRDPYAIWLSEVMLQQTRVQTVIPYWQRFLERFPTVNDLAEAPQDDVLSLWRGLGYYSRARNLHLAAKAISQQGSFPRTAEELGKLPGFGRYTAGAVASIGFGEAAPVVDGNVARVFARLFLVEGAPGERDREKALWSLAEQWVVGPRPGDWNQALMELGALICRPEAPTCLICPLRDRCGALQAGRVAELPPVRVRAARKRLELLVAVWRDGDKVLLARRAGGGLFGGLWELPSAEAITQDPAPLRALLGKVEVDPELCRVQRTLTHRDLVLRLHPVQGPRAPSDLEGYDALCWASPLESAQLGMSTAMHKALLAASEAAPAAERVPRPRQRKR
ncbi:MAG: A/G-specific adenine glycosylase [Myxococcota bacterium]|nr:A/G-specific adenine glycosylase [Myxococcota bacterium]